ncbi:hypothetical protein F5Y15DRAFT_386232 [Xylariaceae sp. FL0016]|nr:hypothetical protein F5Y15DRAFT_386232 [Xylariaceae sp. FL0016]
MDPVETEANPTQPIVFRGKKRKFYRQRTDANGEPSQAPQPAAQPASTAQPSDSPLVEPATDADAAADETAQGLSVAEALRLRNARRAKFRGVKFGGDGGARNDLGAAPGGDEDDLMRMIREEEGRVLDTAAGVNKRFAPQTGLAGELVNKHMEEYIEAELAKRHTVAPDQTFSVPGHPSSSRVPGIADTNSKMNTADGKNKDPARHTALNGELMEIDLGDEVRSRNEAMTRRILRGEAVEAEEQIGRPKKVRLGRDGKPWRSRNRRTSDDVKRDQLVEEILRENRLDVYEAPTPPPATNTGPDDDDGAADDRIAEAFRREFLDAMAERQQKKKPVAPPAKPGARKDEEVLKGPKLGGSRNARAAMRDLLLKKEREGKK